jgi:hypothetical protein
MGANKETDRELLELAAKAVGINYHHISDEGVWWRENPMSDLADCWNPLTDDGDALRLAVKLGLQIDTPKYLGFGSSCGNMTVFRDGCPYAQTRQAVVRAAAEIGRSAPAPAK